MDLLSFMLGTKAGGGGGGSSVTVESLTVATNDTYTAPAGKAYSPVVVNVPNSYSAGDEGKVVSNGALVAQSSDTVTQNGTVDTTLINSLLVNVSGGGGASNVVLGSFTGEESGVNTVSLPYEGSGYPVAVFIWIPAGIYDTSGEAYQLQLAYVPLLVYAVKGYADTPPTYQGSGDADKALVQQVRISNAAGSLTQESLVSGFTYRASASSYSATSIIGISGSTTLKVYIKPINNTGYGFPVGVKYNYCVVYSS